MVVFLLLVWCGVNYELPPKLAPIFSYRGDIYYAVYEMHFTLLMVFLMLQKRLHLHSLSATGLFVLCICILASAVVHWFDASAADVARVHGRTGYVALDHRLTDK